MTLWTVSQENVLTTITIPKGAAYIFVILYLPNLKNIEKFFYLQCDKNLFSLITPQSVEVTSVKSYTKLSIVVPVLKVFLHECLFLTITLENKTKVLALLKNGNPSFKATTSASLCSEMYGSCLQEAIKREAQNAFYNCRSAGSISLHYSLNEG